MSELPTNGDDVNQLVSYLTETLDVKTNKTIVRHLLTSALTMATSEFQRLNLKIAADSLRELANAFKIFEPYHQQRKITLFGSARTSPSDPAYAAAREVALRLASLGWMTITGAGQGIMQAGLEGAGPEMSFGVNIKLPFEQSANPAIVNNPKLVEMKYFFTRKVMLIKESDGFVIMPGGFGTLDETFELLTLIQTGKAQPAPVVLLDANGGTYWEQWQHFISNEVVSRGLVSLPDQELYLITHDVERAIREIIDFYRNYHSIRFADDQLIIRIHNQLTDEQLDQINEKFIDICKTGRIERCQATKQEIKDNDHLELQRLSLNFNSISFGRLRKLIDFLNLT